MYNDIFILLYEWLRTSVTSCLLSLYIVIGLTESSHCYKRDKDTWIGSNYEGKAGWDHVVFGNRQSTKGLLSLPEVSKALPHWGRKKSIMYFGLCQTQEIKTKFIVNWRVQYTTRAYRLRNNKCTTEPNLHVIIITQKFFNRLNKNMTPHKFTLTRPIIRLSPQSKEPKALCPLAYKLILVYSQCGLLPAASS